MANRDAQEKCSRSKADFIRLYPEYGAVWPTLKAIGIKRRGTFYDWTKNDAGFKAIYEQELLPNRRDDVASLVYRAATGRLGTVTRTWVEKKTGNEFTEEVPVVLPQTQLTAAFGFLKATDHTDDAAAPDRLIFCEKNQVEISGAGGGPVVLKVVYDGEGADAGV